MNYENTQNKKYFNNEKEIKMINRNSTDKIKDNIKLEYIKFNTPNIIKKDKAIDLDFEMRRTYKMKPPLLSSKFPSVFEIAKRQDGATSNTYIQEDNELLEKDSDMRMNTVVT